jgi:hypothetical protein
MEVPLLVWMAKRVQVATGLLLALLLVGYAVARLADQGAWVRVSDWVGGALASEATPADGPPVPSVGEVAAVLQARLTGLEGVVQQLTGEVAEREAQVVSLRSQVSESEGQRLALAQQLTATARQLARAESAREAERTSSAQMVQRLAAERDALGAQVAQLKAEIAQLKATRSAATPDSQHGGDRPQEGRP